MDYAKQVLDNQIKEAFSGDLELGWLDEIMQHTIEQGFYAPFDDLDVTEPKSKLKLAMGQVGESAGEGLAGGVDASKDQANTAIEGMADSAIDTANKTFETGSPSKVFIRMGGDLVDGLVAGVRNSTWKLRLAMIAMANEAIRAAKSALQIQSPSRVFRDEIGRMMVRGVSLGVELETEQQRRAIANAARQMTLSARGGVRATASRTMNDSRDQSINVNIDTLSTNSRQDVEALAQRISALALRRNRGYGY